jgi:beta-phosphoglucomutase
MTVEIRAFLFDLDGVLTDTAELHYRAWLRLAGEEGMPFSHRENDAMRGLSRRDSLHVLLQGRVIDEATAQDWMARKNAYYLELLAGIRASDMLPGVLAFLDAARAMGLRLGVGSASRNASAVLEKLGIAARFDAVGDGHCVVHGKPAPDLFLWTAGRMNVNPAHTVVFEDAAAGVQAARRGGFYAVGLGDAVGDGAHVRLPGLDSVTPAQVIALLKAH